MDKIASFDRWVIERGDDIVQWVWDEFGLPRTWLLRLAGVCMLVTFWLQHRGEPLAPMEWVLVATWGFCALVEELYARLAGKLQNAMKIDARHGIISVSARLVVYGGLGLQLVSAMREGNAWAAVAAPVILAWYILLNTLTPERPRRPRESFSLARGVA